MSSSSGNIIVKRFYRKKIYPPRPARSVYSGAYLLRAANGGEFYVSAEDRGWDPVTLGKVDSEGNIIREARGDNIIETVIINLATGSKSVFEKRYSEGTIAGIVCAVSHALREEKRRQHYLDFAYSEIQQHKP